MLLKSTRLLSLVIGCLCLFYGLQLFTPLRLNNDSFRLLAMAESAHSGHGFLVQGQPEQLPIGYPALVLVLLKFGIASSFSLVFLNLIFLTFSFVLMSSMFARSTESEEARFHWLLIVCATLSSWALIKHITIPLSEFFYLALSTLALWLIDFSLQQNSSKPKRRILVISSYCIAFFSVYVRTIGISLVVALLYKSLARAISNREHIRTTCIRFAPLCVGALVVTCIVLISNFGVFTVSSYREGSYLESLLRAFQARGVSATLLQNISFRCREIGELALNVPRGMTALPNSIYLLLGGLFWIVISRGAWLLRSQYPVMIQYLTCYTGIMLLWPYYDSRFWIPVLPYLILCVMSVANRYCKASGESCSRMRQLLSIYVVYFVVVGFLACCYSTSVTFSSRFWKDWAGGAYEVSHDLANSAESIQEYEDLVKYKAHLLRSFKEHTAK